MPRSLSVSSIAEIAKRLGTEPITVVGVRWFGDQEIRYADKDVVSGSAILIPGKILEIGSVDEIVRVDSGGTNASVTVKLDDSDGDLKTIIDTTNVHKRRAVVYQYFDGLALSDMFAVLSGEINTPITWSESERALEFTILSKVETREVGFAPEEGQFKTVDSPFIGNVWPLAFGDVLHVPATKITELTRGVTQSLIGIPDYTLPFKYYHLIERVQILESGYRYYVRAIEFLNQIAREPLPIIDDYVEAILREDPRKQRHEDLAEYVTENDKVLEKLEALLKEDEEKGRDDTAIAGKIIELTKLLDQASNRGEPEDVLSTIEAEIQTLQTRKDVEDHVARIKPVLSDRKREIKQLDQDLERLDAVKKLLEIETDNAEYAYKNIHSIIKKIQKLQIEYVKAQHQIFKVLTIMQEHQKIPQRVVTVIGGDKFPQNETVRISINGLTYSGKFVGKQFTADGFEPRYENLKIGPREDDQIDAFWLEDPNVSIKGHYCLTTVRIGPGDPEWILAQNGYTVTDIQNRLFKVVDQIGKKCVIELVELKPSIRLKKQKGHLPVLEDLPDEVWKALKHAREHTEQERTRILENAITKYKKEELDRIKSTLEKLRDIVVESETDDEIASINETVYRNVHEYNDILATGRFTQEAVTKADELISEHEFRTLLKLCNLHLRRVDQEHFDETEIPITKIYYLTGYDIRHINATSPVMLPAWFQFSPGGQEFVTDKTVVSLPGGTQVIADFLPESSLWFAEPGSEVQLVSDQTEKFVANILPSDIRAVYAYKGVSGIRQLVPIPKAYYRTSEADPYLPLVCTTVTLNKPLKDYDGEDWEDGIYVSMQSSVGPLTTSIISWILANYTNVAPDAASFAHVATKLANFPSSFALLSKRDALQLIQEITWQARCVAWVRGTMMFLKYLSEQPTPAEAIGDDDVIFGSLSLEHTPSEDIVTKFVAKWQPDYSRPQDKVNKLVLRYNVIRYGEIEKEFDFYIYNDERLVNKSATFWLIRLANTWKRIKFRTPLTKLAIETLDAVTVTSLFSTGSVIGVVEKAAYDSAANEIDFECWLPVRAGEMVPYDFAWPANVSTTKLYPSVDDINAGYAGSSHSSVPRDLAYKIDSNRDLIEQLDLRPKDYGEAFPADAAFATPASPLAGLDAQDYIVLRPGEYTLPGQPRFSEDGAVPTYEGPVNTSGTPNTKRLAFNARIKSIRVETSGKYTVVDNAGHVYDVKQAGHQEKLNIGQPVVAVYDAPSNQYLINERPSETAGEIQYYLAEITAASGAGQRSTYLVKIFDGKDIAATKKDPKETSVTAIQEVVTQYFFNGEAVAVHKKAGNWIIEKLNTTALRTKFEANELGMRAAQNGTGTPSTSLRFVAESVTYSLIDAHVDYKTVVDYIYASPNNKTMTVVGNILGRALVINYHKDCLVPFVPKAGNTPFVTLRTFEGVLYSGSNYNLVTYNTALNPQLVYNNTGFGSAFGVPQATANLSASGSATSDYDQSFTSGTIPNQYSQRGTGNGSYSINYGADLSFSGGSPTLSGSASVSGDASVTLEITDPGTFTTGVSSKTINASVNGSLASVAGSLTITYTVTSTAVAANVLNDATILATRMSFLGVSVSVTLTSQVKASGNRSGNSLSVVVDTAPNPDELNVVAAVGPTSTVESITSYQTATGVLATLLNPDLTYLLQATVAESDVASTYNLPVGSVSGPIGFAMGSTLTTPTSGAMTVSITG